MPVFPVSMQRTIKDLTAALKDIGISRALFAIAVTSGLGACGAATETDSITGDSEPVLMAASMAANAAPDEQTDETTGNPVEGASSEDTDGNDASSESDIVAVEQGTVIDQNPHSALDANTNTNNDLTDTGTDDSDPSAMSAMELIQSNPVLSSLALAIQSDDTLSGYLGDPNQIVTVLAPTNAAFDELAQWQRDIFTDYPQCFTELIKQGVIPSLRLTADAAEILGTANTINAGALTFYRDENSLYFTSSFTGSSDNDLRASEIMTSGSAVVHVVDGFNRLERLTFDFYRSDYGCNSSLGADNGAIQGSEQITASPGVGFTAYDFLVNSSDHTTLVALLDQAGLADTLDASWTGFTIFAPTNAAFAALDAAAPGTLDALTAEPLQLRETLLHHVVNGFTQSTDISTGVTDAAAANSAFILYTSNQGDFTQALSFSSEPNGQLVITDGSGNTTPLIGPLDLNLPTEVGIPMTGVVHVLDTVLLPNLDGVFVEESPGPGPESGSAGGLADIFSSETDASFDGFILGATDFETVLTQPQGNDELNSWTVFASTDAALAGRASSFQDSVVVTAAYSPAELIAIGSLTTNSGIPIAIGGTADALTVNGFPARLVWEGSSIIYRIDGIIQ